MGEVSALSGTKASHVSYSRVTSTYIGGFIISLLVLS